MNDTIGQAAGHIWHMLEKANGPVNVTTILKKTKLTSSIAYQGLGWLAREGKVEYRQKGRTTYICLADAECVC